MLTTVLDTSEVPPADRFDMFDDAVGKLMAPADRVPEQDRDFPAVVRAASLGQAGLFTLTSPGMRARRTPSLVRGYDAERYQITMVTGGRQSFDHGDRQVSAGPGELLLNDPSRPYNMYKHSDAGATTCTVVAVPRAALALPERHVESIMAAPLSGTTGIGGLLTSFMTGLTDDSNREEFRPGDAAQLGRVLTDLVAALVAHELEDLTPAASPRDVLVLQIRAYIQANLADPDLNPARIAAAHHISVRYLHKLFEGEHESVAAMIRQQRLARTRQELADPAMRDEPLHVIAARWGFTHPSHFTRAFRAAYGYPPSQERGKQRDS